MCADRRGSAGSRVGPYTCSKILNLGYALVGAAGDAGAAVHLAEVVGSFHPHTLIPQITGFIRETKLEANILLITVGGAVGFFEGGGSFEPLKKTHSYCCLGSGEEHAWGFLNATARHEEITPSIAKLCIKDCGKFNLTVGDGTQVEWLSGAKP